MLQLGCGNIGVGGGAEKDFVPETPEVLGWFSGSFDPFGGGDHGSFYLPYIKQYVEEIQGWQEGHRFSQSGPRRKAISALFGEGGGRGHIAAAAAAAAMQGFHVGPYKLALLQVTPYHRGLRIRWPATHTRHHLRH